MYKIAWWGRGILEQKVITSVLKYPSLGEK
jgi:hypothetical protein